MARTADPTTQLSRAVWDVLANQGIERLTIRAVAAAAGCTTGLVMHRYPNRQALLRHARQLLHERTRERVESLEADATDAKAALRAVLAQGLVLDEETASESIVWVGFLAAAVGDDQLMSLHHANNRVWREERVTATAFALMAMAEGAAALASTDPDAYPPATQLAMLDTTLAAFGL
jgi:TetR/AcrR family transcriptional repressor of bet genes